MIIILEGCDLSGKTSVARELQDRIPLGVGIKLSGSPKQVETNTHMRNIYESLVPFFYACREHNIVLDRFCTSERVYTPLFKTYDVNYLDEYENSIVNMFDVHMFYLDVDRDILEERIEIKRQMCPNEKHASIDSLMVIKREYENQILNFSKIPATFIKVDSLWTTPKDIAEDILARLNVTIGKNFSEAYTNPK